MKFQINERVRGVRKQRTESNFSLYGNLSDGKIHSIILDRADGHTPEESPLPSEIKSEVLTAGISALTRAERIKVLDIYFWSETDYARARITTSPGTSMNNDIEFHQGDALVVTKKAESRQQITTRVKII